MSFEIYIAATFFLLATILYGVVPWWRTLFGRLLFSTLFGLTLVIVLAALTTAFGADFPGRHYVRLVIYTIVLCISVLVLFGVLYAQLQGATRNVRVRDPREPR